MALCKSVTQSCLLGIAYLYGQNEDSITLGTSKEISWVVTVFALTGAYLRFRFVTCQDRVRLFYHIESRSPLIETSLVTIILTGRISFMAALLSVVTVRKTVSPKLNVLFGKFTVILETCYWPSPKKPVVIDLLAWTENGLGMAIGVWPLITISRQPW